MTEPTISTANTSNHYLGERGETYFGWQKGGAEFRASILVRKFRPYVSDGDTVVDFGCGGGFVLDKLRCSRRIGIEINPVAQAHATEVLGIECVQTPNELPSAVADVIISNHALEHVPFPIGMLRDLKRVLKPEGTLVLCVPLDLQRDQSVFREDDQNNHLHTWTSQLLGNTLREAGFVVEKIEHDISYVPSGYTVFVYGRFPYWFYCLVSWCCGFIAGRGHELVAVAKPLKQSSSPSSFS